MPAASQDDVGVFLIHADGAGADTGAHTGDTCQVAETLPWNPSSAKRPVHHREYGVQTGDLHLTVPDSHQAVHRTVGERKAGRLPLSSSQEWSMSFFTSPV